MSIYSDRLAHVQVVSNCSYFVAQMCTHEDILYVDEVMIYNSLTTLIEDIGESQL